MNQIERQQMISKVLAPPSQDQDGAHAIATRTLWSWEQVAFHLTPLIGDAGLQSLYARAMHLVLPQCPALGPPQRNQQSESSFHKLKSDLESMDAAEAARASNLLLATFTELLSTLIGESLTSRILRSAWTDEAGNIIGKEFGE
jgi:hypothetical protein